MSTNYIDSIFFYSIFIILFFFFTPENKFVSLTMSVWHAFALAYLRAHVLKVFSFSNMLKNFCKLQVTIFSDNLKLTYHSVPKKDSLI